MDLLSEITQLNKRSFASKYLHFHFPHLFYIYDSRAAKSVSQLVEDRTPILEGRDATYARFFGRCEELGRSIGDLIGRDLDPRDVDKVLLAWSHLKGA